jgi:glyoxylase-like metal-dependent hydrolase (beta-lactamase superfamily II)
MRFEKGFHQIGSGNFAYLQPSGTWGYSNAGLIIDGGEALLVDTLFDERLTAEMLSVMREATGFGAGEISQLVNTHANGDHTFGNRLLTRARIIASAATDHEMREDAPPEMLASVMSQTGKMGQLGAYLDEIFGAFDFAGVKLRVADEHFDGAEKRLRVGGKDVDLIVVGPAHTGGDTLVHVPQDRILYTGDILFIDGTPISWSGPVRNWIAACDRILNMDVDIIVPGHGPVTDKKGVRANREYLTFVEAQAKARHATGMDSWEAAQDISLGAFGALEDPERIAVTVDTVYRELNNDHSKRDVMEMFGRMAELDRRYRAQGLGRPRVAPTPLTHGTCGQAH